MILRSCATRLISKLSTGSSSLSKSTPNINNKWLSSRSFLTSPTLFVEMQENAQVNALEDNLELRIKDSEKETYVEAIPVKTGREGKVIETPSKHACALCRLDLPSLDYTDVLILDQFIKKNGSIVTFHESKLCSKQYRKITKLIEQAQRCNLVKRPADYLVPGPWHDLNTYLEPDRKRDQPMKIIKKEYWKI